MTRKKAVFNWSGSKDSALALYKVLQSNEFEVVSLPTTVNKNSGPHLSMQYLTNSFKLRLTVSAFLFITPCFPKKISAFTTKQC